MYVHLLSGMRRGEWIVAFGVILSDGEFIDQVGNR